MSEPADTVPGEGWYQSPSGTVGYADGDGQAAAMLGQGWTPVDEDRAKEIVALGAHLTVQSDVNGTFDADAVQEAVREEADLHAARSAAAKKAAQTRAANKAAKDTPAGEVELSDGTRVTGVIPDDERTRPATSEG